MKANSFRRCICLALFITLLNSPGVLSQTQPPLPRLFIGGGALPDAMYDEFARFAGTEGLLVVIPTATGREIDEAKIKADWASSGFKSVAVLHTRDREKAAKPEFSAILKEAQAVWFSGGSQQRIADAYLGTPVEEEIYNLARRGGVIGGSSAGAAIMSRVMISGGNPDPDITTGFDLLPGVILDQHFLKRNRLARLSRAVHNNVGLIGLGIDEATAIIIDKGELKVVGESYVIRLAVIKDQLKVDAYKAGETIPLN